MSFWNTFDSLDLMKQCCINGTHDGKWESLSITFESQISAKDCYQQFTDFWNAQNDAYGFMILHHLTSVFRDEHTTPKVYVIHAVISGYAPF